MAYKLSYKSSCTKETRLLDSEKNAPPPQAPQKSKCKHCHFIKKYMLC